MVPLITSVADAQNVAKYAKFPPQGTRGLGSPFSMEKFHPDISQMQYFREANSSTVVILQIETKTALDAVREIAAVEGIDVLLIGPYDLGNNIGHPVFDATKFDPELEEAIETIHQATQAAGKCSAIYTSSGDAARGYADRGFNMVNVLTDVVALKQTYGAEVENCLLYTSPSPRD